MLEICKNNKYTAGSPFWGMGKHFQYEHPRAEYQFIRTSEHWIFSPTRRRPPSCCLTSRRPTSRRPVTPWFLRIPELVQ